MPPEFQSSKGYWPIRIIRCFHCRHLLWPWQSIVLEDPWESGMPVHHECHHRYCEELFSPEHNWRRSLDCEHREN